MDLMLMPFGCSSLVRRPLFPRTKWWSPPPYEYFAANSRSIDWASHIPLLPVKSRIMEPAPPRPFPPRHVTSRQALPPCPVQPREAAGPGDEFGGGAVLHDAAVLHHQDPVRDLHRRQAVGDDHRGAAV